MYHQRKQVVQIQIKLTKIISSKALFIDVILAYMIILYYSILIISLQGNKRAKHTRLAHKN